jgi:hypothetical protein
MRGDVAIMNGRSAPECPALAPIIQPFMEFLGDVFAAGPSGVEPVCDSLLEWLTTVNETDRFSLIGALSDAVEYCPVEDRVISAMCNYFFANWRVFSDPDVQHNVASFMAMLVRTRPEHISTAREMLPIVTDWWRHGLCKRSGYEEMLVNCASFFLALVAVDSTSVDNALTIAAIGRFPPAQRGETTAMAESLLAVAQSSTTEIQAAAAAALARLLTEPKSVRDRRAIPESLMARILEAFRWLMAWDSIRHGIVASYQRKRTKAAALQELLA